MKKQAKVEPSPGLFAKSSAEIGTKEELHIYDRCLSAARRSFPVWTDNMGNLTPIKSNTQPIESSMVRSISQRARRQPMRGEDSWKFRNPLTVEASLFMITAILNSKGYWAQSTGILLCFRIRVTRAELEKQL